MKEEKCKHQRTRSLFYMDHKKKTWRKAEKILCLDCGKIVELKISMKVEE